MINHIRACIANATGALSCEKDNETASSDSVLSKRVDAAIEIESTNVNCQENNYMP